MPYFDPRMVISPKISVEKNSVRVLHDGREWEENDKWRGWSVAELVWDGQPAVGIRWNGDGENVGNPQSRGVPTWFILPEVLAKKVVEAVRSHKSA